ncbi:MAG TPA: hypothetical protein VFQ05_08005 [Candidatus Eisenbacteria bacterium]|nr:hypothetical protein [Candidatus Eisenbacteria bacterium]
MSRNEDLDLHYLRALRLLNASLNHGLNNHLASLNFQLDISSEVLRRASPGDGEAWEKLKIRSAKANEAMRSLKAFFDHVLATTRPSEKAEASLDLRGVIRNVEALLSPFHKDRNTELLITLPDQPLMLEGTRDVIQRVLLVTLLEASLALKKEERLELRLDVDGTLEIEGPLVHQWLPAVADIIENIGGGFDASPTGSVVALRIPIQTSTR